MVVRVLTQLTREMDSVLYSQLFFVVFMSHGIGRVKKLVLVWVEGGIPVSDSGFWFSFVLNGMFFRDCKICMHAFSFSTIQT